MPKPYNVSPASLWVKNKDGNDVHFEDLLAAALGNVNIQVTTPPPNQIVTINSLNDASIEISRGAIEGAEPFELTGFDLSLNQTDQTVGLGELYIPPVSVATVQIVSTDAADNFTGIGAQLLRVAGLDNLNIPIEEFIAPNGVTPVVLVNQYKTLNSLQVVQSGSNNRNVGEIIATDAGTGNKLADIQENRGLGVFGHFTVPDGKIIIPSSLSVVSGKDNAQFEYQVLAILSDGTKWTIRQGVVYRTQLSENVRFSPLGLIAGQRLEFEGRSTGTDLTVSMSINGILMDDDLVL